MAGEEIFAWRAELLLVLGIDPHRSKILLKLNLHSVTELVLHAVRNEIVHVQLPSVRRLPRSGNSRKDLTIN